MISSTDTDAPTADEATVRHWRDLSARCTRAAETRTQTVHVTVHEKFIQASVSSNQHYPPPPPSLARIFLLASLRATCHLNKKKKKIAKVQSALSGLLGRLLGSSAGSALRRVHAASNTLEDLVCKTQDQDKHKKQERAPRSDSSSGVESVPISKLGTRAAEATRVGRGSRQVYCGVGCVRVPMTMTGNEKATTMTHSTAVCGAISKMEERKGT